MKKNKEKKWSGWIPAKAGQVFKDRKKEANRNACRVFKVTCRNVKP